MPGRGSIRRWIREAPEGFAFTVLAPKILGESSFKKTAEGTEALDAVMGLCDELGSHAIVFSAAETFKPTKANRAALKRFAARLPKDGITPVFDLPAWKPAQVVEASGRADVVAAYDPLLSEPAETGPMRYIRVAGPAGHRSRYDEQSIEQLAQHLEQFDDFEERDTFFVFCNIDMQTNANQLISRLG